MTPSSPQGEYGVPAPRVAVCTLILNEAHWLPYLFRQHRGWPGMAAWVFVEGADRAYRHENPGMVSVDGLSVDGTTFLLSRLADADPRVRHVRLGYFGDRDDPNGKAEARDAGLRAVEAMAGGDRFDLLVVLDADEFYTHSAQRRVNNLTALAAPHHRSFRLRNREVWFPPCWQRALSDADLKGRDMWAAVFGNEAVGGYWGVRHHRFWRWEPGLHYLRGRTDGHNFLLSPEGTPLHLSCMKYDMTPGTPECVHLGFASPLQSRAAKHFYYQARGEGRERQGRNRQSYVECRAAWETWQPGDGLPHGAEVRAYDGPIPECFRDGKGEVLL